MRVRPGAGRRRPLGRAGGGRSAPPPPSPSCLPPRTPPPSLRTPESPRLTGRIRGGTQGSEVKANSWVFDLDDQRSKDAHFFKYAFNFPERIPAELRGTFDFVVIDPPFITRKVWEKYAEAAHLLLCPRGKILLTTVR